MIVLGSVHGIESAPDVPPLVFCKGAYGAFATALD